MREAFPRNSSLREEGTSLLRDPLPSAVWQHLFCLQQYYQWRCVQHVQQVVVRQPLCLLHLRQEDEPEDQIL